MNLTRREILALTGAAIGKDDGAADVRRACRESGRGREMRDLQRCGSGFESEDNVRSAGRFGEAGRNKTVTVKLNLTGSPGQRFEGRPLGVTHYTHPMVIAATAHLMGEAGAKRIRFVESAWALSGPLEDYLLDSGWNVKQLSNAAPNVEFENTNNLGKSKDYVRFKVPGQPYMFPAYDLNRAYHDTDVFVSMAKLKNHATCGVTLSMKNCFGITPASIYGDDAGVTSRTRSRIRAAFGPCTRGSAIRRHPRCAELDPKARVIRDTGCRASWRNWR